MHSALSSGFTYNGTHYTGDQAAVAQGDNFLSLIVPMIMSSAAYKNGGAIVIWYDETEGGDTKQYTLPEIVISPLAKGDAYDSILTYTHPSDLKTMEELFGAYNPDGSFLGDAGTPGTNDLSDLFLAGSVVPEPSSLVLYAIGAAWLAGTGGGESERTVSAQLILDVLIGEVGVDRRRLPSCASPVNPGTVTLGAITPWSSSWGPLLCLGPVLRPRRDRSRQEEKGATEKGCQERMALP